MAMETGAKKRIGELLVDRGIVSERDVSFAISEKYRKEPLVQALVRLDILRADKEEEAWRVLAEQLDVPYFQPGTDFHWDLDLLKSVPLEFAREKHCLPLARKGGYVYVGMTNPMDFQALESARIMLDSRVKSVLISRETFEEGLLEYSSTETENFDEHAINFDQDALLEMEGQEEEEPAPEVSFEEPAEIEMSAEDRMEFVDLDVDVSGLPPITRMFRGILKDAIDSGASDIHVETAREQAAVRFRIDGVLYRRAEIGQNNISAFISIIKVQSGMDIAERRLPQDGRFSSISGGQEVDFRVSSIPTVFGEKVVLRLLRRGTGLLRLDRLGLDGETEKALLESISGNSGIILVTGPTGSGKSTTLYSLLRELDLEHLNVITIEDPVEYQMSGITQISVRTEIGLSFSSILRTVLRQDPDVVMLGEIRDFETAEMAIRAALTGHLVLSTLHTNNAPASIDRLTDMGIKPYLLASALRFVGAQRLVRKVCPHCAESYQPDEHVLALFPEEELQDMKFTRGAGCPRCGNTGYSGRMALLEYLRVRCPLVRTMARGEDSVVLRKLALENGLFFPIVRPGLRAVRKGLTTVEEVARVITEV